MLGQNTALDLAARAVVLYYLPDRFRTTISDGEAPSYTAYRAALESLRATLSTSESSLVTTGLLALYELLRKQHAVALHTHAAGITAIVDARLREGGISASTLFRAAFYDNSLVTFTRPVFLGEPSPFEHPAWLSLEPAVMGSMQPGVQRTRKLAQEILLRLPRVIAMVRRVRQSTTNASNSGLSNAIQVANELLALKDEKAENKILQTLKLVPIPREDVVDSPPGLASLFSFASVSSRDAILGYWAARLMVLKLRLVLCRFQSEMQHDTPLSVSSSSSSSPGHNPLISTLEHEQAGLILCILMCWNTDPNTNGNGGFGHNNVIIILWSALADLSNVRGHDAQTIRDWMLRRHNEEMGEWSDADNIHTSGYDAEQADADADVLAGGPLEGSSLLSNLRELGLIPPRDAPASAGVG